MQVRFSLSVLVFSALLLLTPPAFSAGDSAPSGEGVSPRCEAAIHKAAGNYSRCLLKTTAMYGKQGQRGKKLLAKQERCEINFNRRVELAQDRYGEDQCTPYVSEIAVHIMNSAEDVSGAAGGLQNLVGAAAPTSNYNCFIGAFCSELAVLGYLLAEDGNLYAGDTPGTAPALDAGCNESPGISRWLNGKDLHYWDIPHQHGSEDPGVFLCTDQTEDNS